MSEFTLTSHLKASMQELNQAFIDMRLGNDRECNIQSQGRSSGYLEGRKGQAN
jgi:hypothetical protein